MSPFGLAVGPGENMKQTLSRNGLAAITSLRTLSNPRQHSHTRFEIQLCDISQQFVTKFVGSCVDLPNYSLGAPTELHSFASAIVWRICACNPSLSLQPIQ